MNVNNKQAAWHSVKWTICYNFFIFGFLHCFRTYLLHKFAVSSLAWRASFYFERAERWTKFRKSNLYKSLMNPASSAPAPSPENPQFSPFLTCGRERLGGSELWRHGETAPKKYQYPPIVNKCWRTCWWRVVSYDPTQEQKWRSFYDRSMVGGWWCQVEGGRRWILGRGVFCLSPSLQRWPCGCLPPWISCFLSQFARVTRRDSSPTNPSPP